MAAPNFKRRRVEPKRKAKFNENWISEIPCIGKSQFEGNARCTLCACDFTMTSGGRADFKRHIETTRHRKLSKATTATKGGIGQYIAQGNNAIDGVKRAETKIAYWVAYHNVPMSATDELSKMLPGIFPDSKIAKTYSSGKHTRHTKLN